MTPDEMTLPITPHDFWLGMGLIAFVMLSVLIFWVLNQMDKTDQLQLWDDLPAKWRWPVVLMGLVWLGLFGLTVWAAFAGVWQTINPKDASSQPSLGFGTLLVALLGAPFLIWTTVLKHQTVRYQKEGHMTDRINKAVEQLGAEKTVERIGRPVTVWTGTPERVNYATEDAVKFIGQTRTQVSTKEWDQTWNDEAEEVEEGYRSTVSIWPSERTIIQWQGETIAVSADEAIGIESPWQVFKETQPNLEVRIGAILSLERIAQDSTTHDKGRDHVRVMEILCAYVRENSRALSLEPKADSAPFKTPRLDLQTTMMVIKRRSKEQLSLEATARYRLDLRSVDFGGMDLSKGDLSAAMLWHSRFEGANLSETVFNGTQFTGSLLNHTRWYKSQLKGTVLDGCAMNHINRTAFALANHTGVFVEGADISAFYITGRFADNLFGSFDTIVDPTNASDKAVGLQMAADFEILDDSAEDQEKREHLMQASTDRQKWFLHWNPYTRFDGAAPSSRTRYRQRKGLTGWPFEE